MASSTGQANSLGLDEALFLTDLYSLLICGLCPFCCSVLRSCALLKWAHVKEPWIDGGRFDINCGSCPTWTDGGAMAPKDCYSAEATGGSGSALSDV